MQTETQLFCFTYAGGTTDFFDLIEKEMPGIKLEKLEYPGHGKKHKEEFAPSIEQIADELTPEIIGRVSGDYALFGYSMGSICAVEVLNRIVKTGFKLPRHVFVAAHEPHTKSELIGFSPDELDEWVKERTIQFGDIPEKLQNNSVFWRMYLPVYRADYTAIGNYDFEALSLETEIPATVFYSESDTPLKDMKEWKKYFKGSLDFIRFDGNHFFIREHYKEMANDIITRLGR